MLYENKKTALGLLPSAKPHMNREPNWFVWLWASAKGSKSNLDLVIEELFEVLHARCATLVNCASLNHG
jgi:hypothetical protein